MPNQNSSIPRINVYATITYWLLLFILLAVPVAILPFFDNFVIAGKSLLLMLAASLTFGIFTFKAATKGKLQLPVSPFVVSLFAFGVAILLSSFLSTRYPVKNLIGMGGMYLSVVTIAILGGSLLPKKKGLSFISALSLVGSVLSVTTFLQAVGFGPSTLINSVLPLQLPNDLTFNLAGSPFVAAQILGVSLLGAIVYMAKSKKLSKLLVVTAIINLAGFVVNAWISLPGQLAAPLLLPFSASWPIALDTLRTPRPALIGVGPDNYGIAYSIFRPAWTNVTEWWNVQFIQGTSAPLTLLTTTGLIGLGSWLMILWTSFKQLKLSKKDDQLFALVSVVFAILAFQIFFSANIVMLTILAVAMAFVIASTKNKFLDIQTFSMKMTSTDMFMRENHNRPQFAKYLAGFVGVVLTGVLLYGIGRSYLASNTIFRSLLAIQDNNAVQVYQLQQTATQLNPYMDSYRRRYALTNMQIAAALSNKTDLTEEEQTQMAQLIQQAIREARAATVLGPDDAQNWIAIAQIYRNLIGTAEDAPQWAVSAYVQAIETAPVDPNLRIELGGIFYNQEEYSQALSLFQQAADLKPDLPNSYYNAANTLKILGQYEQAKLAYQKTLLLLEPDSESYLQASKELEEVETMIAENQDEQAEGTQEDTQTQIPSILNQNVNQSGESVVNTPSSQPLEQDSQTQTGEEEQGQFNPEQTQPATEQ